MRSPAPRLLVARVWAVVILSLTGLPARAVGRAAWSAAAPLHADPDRAGHAPAPLSPPLGLPDRGDYADSFVPLTEQVRAYERQPENRYTYCIRNTATYDCVSYGSDGALRHQASRAVAHGTGFAYREEGGETYLLTNRHVVAWPSVTDATHAVEDVPAGCKLTGEAMKIVDNEDDDYAADDLPLSRVVADVALDMAVVKAHARLHLLPYRVGRSAALHVGDVVMVRGFPLGAFQAYNTGKVVNPYDHDEYKDWDHVDFIIDAPLSQGNSGSPVLALSRRTGEYELVGVFHASYTRANALNAVVGVDQMRDLMQALRPGASAARAPLGPSHRAQAVGALGQASFLPYLGLGPLSIAVRRAGDSLIYEVFSRRFPLDDRRLALLIDEPAAGGFGTLGATWFGNERGLREYAPASLDSDTQAQLQSVLRRVQSLLVGTVRYRAVQGRAANTRPAVSERAAMQRALAREAAGDAELAQGLIDLAERLGPRPLDVARPYAAIMADLPPDRREPPTCVLTAGPAQPAAAPVPARAAAGGP